MWGADPPHDVGPLRSQRLASALCPNPTTLLPFDPSLCWCSSRTSHVIKADLDSRLVVLFPSHQTLVPEFPI